MTYGIEHRFGERGARAGLHFEKLFLPRRKLKGVFLYDTESCVSILNVKQRQ